MVAWRLVGVWQPCLWRTAEGKIEDQKEFVRWWKETVRREGQTEKTSADRGTFLPMSEAEVRKASVAFLRKFWPAHRVGQTSAGHLSESVREAARNGLEQPSTRHVRCLPAPGAASLGQA